MKLTAKQERFVKEYLVDLNATQAAIRSGYSVKTANVIGGENLIKPCIAEAIRIEQDKTSNRLEISRETILEDLKRIQNSTETTNPNASLKSIDLQIKMLGFNSPILSETKLTGNINLKDLLDFED